MRYYLFIFIVYEVLSCTYLYNLYQSNKEDYHHRIIEVAENSLKSTVEAYEMVYDDAYANQSDTISKYVAMANNASVEERDAIRRKLLYEFMVFFNHQKLNALNGMHIFDVNGKSLLRFHQPKHHDDNIIEKRASLKALKQSYKYQKGFEVGVFQESYRFQYPLFYDGVFVGSYEYSVDSQAIIDEMENFYGDAIQFLFKAEALQKVVLKERLEANYTKFLIGSQNFYIKKYCKRKGIDKARFSYIRNLQSFQNALTQTSPSIVDYKYDGHYYAVVILPVKDIEHNNFAYILIHLNNTPLYSLQKTFFIELLLVTFFGLLLYIYTMKEIVNKRYIKELINLQHDLIVVSDGEHINDANSAFLHFFGCTSLEQFQEKYPCVCDMFIEGDGYLQKTQENMNWIKYLQIHQEKQHKVKMLNSSKDERIFSVEMENIKDSHKFFILFKDITEELDTKKELERRANNDTLTHIPNRSRFEYFLEQELEKVKNGGNVFSLIMFDIDYFKNINDTYGHDVGDIVLKELTALVSTHMRKADIFARWGGEEFMIISHYSIYQSEMFAEKLRQIIEEYNFSKVGSITCSFGLTQYRKNDNAETIVKRCDNMLYSAKASGRNCVASLK